MTYIAIVPTTPESARHLTQVGLGIELLNMLYEPVDYFPFKRDEYFVDTDGNYRSKKFQTITGHAREVLKPARLRPEKHAKFKASKEFPGCVEIQVSAY